MSVGGGASKQQQQSSSQSRSNAEGFGFNQSGSFVDPSQAPFLEQLRQSAFGVYNQAQPMLTGMADSFKDQSSGAIGNLLGLGNPSQVINAQLTGLRSGLDDIYTQGLNRIGDNAIQAGAFGGSRQGAAEGVLGGEIGKAFTQGFGDIMANATQQAIGANTAAIGGMGQSLRDQLLARMGGTEALAGILGGPTVLNAAQGIDYNRAQSQSTSNSSGSGQDARFSFGIK